MRIASLGSGSRGNATLLSVTEGCVLVDCGFSLREVQRRAADKDFALANIKAILVTHEHSDHCSGVAALSRHLRIPVYLTHGTLASGKVDGCYETRAFNAGEQLCLAGMNVFAVAVPHDAREPVQYVFEQLGRRIGVLTDLGSVTPHVSEAFADCDALLLEFNHDTELLANGPYPPALKRRVGGDWGHLSNLQALELLQQLDLNRLEHLAVAHTSDKNNCRDRIASSLGNSLGNSAPSLLQKLVWATQETGFDWLEVRGEDSEAEIVPADMSTASLARAPRIGAYYAES